MGQGPLVREHLSKSAVPSCVLVLAVFSWSPVPWQSGLCGSRSAELIRSGRIWKNQIQLPWGVRTPEKILQTLWNSLFCCSFWRNQQYALIDKPGLGILRGRLNWTGLSARSSNIHAALVLLETETPENSRSKFRGVRFSATPRNLPFGPTSVGGEKDFKQTTVQEAAQYLPKGCSRKMPPSFPSF